jgi:hypothetical protein
MKPRDRAPLGRRLVWFGALWIAGVAAVAAVACTIKFALPQ